MVSSSSRVTTPSPAALRSELKFTRIVFLLVAVGLAVFAAIAGIKQYFGNPINCWTPTELGYVQTQYAQSLCYFSDVFYSWEAARSPAQLENNPKANVYKWTPFFLLLFAILYLLPEFFFRVLLNGFTLNVDNLFALSRRSETAANENERNEAVKRLTTEMQSILRDRRSKSRKKMFSLPLTIKLQYIGSKLLFLICSIIPIIVIFSNVRVSLNLSQQLSHVIGRPSLDNDTAFPDKLLCAVDILLLDNIQRFTFQCFLPSNDLFQRLTLVAGIFSLIVLSFTLCDFIAFLLFKTSTNNVRKDFFIGEQNQLKVDVSNGVDGAMSREFTERYLGDDGVYLLDLIAQNSSEAIVCRVHKALWECDQIN